jgi:hypothetical protein
VLDAASAAVLADWTAALEDWARTPRAPAPLLQIAGLLGDGAESLLAWLATALSARSANGAVVSAETGLAPPALPALRRKWRSERVHPEPGTPWQLPAFAFRPARAVAGTTGQASARAPTQAELLRAVDQGRGIRVPLALVVRRPPVAEHRHRSCFVLDLTRAPLAGTLAVGRLPKADARTWLALEQRRPTESRLAAAWARRLRLGGRWLDGTEPTVRGELDRASLTRTAPFCPVVLQAAQAVLDSLARRGLDPPSLAFLVEDALARRAPAQAAGLVPLDALLGPLFGRPLEADAPLARRARLVVQALQLCPELSRGSKGLALLLASSLDADLDAAVGELEALLQPVTFSLFDAQPRSSEASFLSVERNSWCCSEPLIWRGELAAAWAEGIFRSEDGGLSWDQAARLRQR